MCQFFWATLYNVCIRTSVTLALTEFTYDKKTVHTAHIYILFTDFYL